MLRGACLLFQQGCPFRRGGEGGTFLLFFSWFIYLIPSTNLVWNSHCYGTPIALLVSSSLRASEAARTQISGNDAPIPRWYCVEGRENLREVCLNPRVARNRPLRELSFPGSPDVNHCANYHTDGREGDCMIIYPILSLSGTTSEAYSS